MILDFLRLKENSVFAIHEISGLKLLTRLRLNFSHLSEYKLENGHLKGFICYEPIFKKEQLLLCFLFFFVIVSFFMHRTCL